MQTFVLPKLDFTSDVWYLTEGDGEPISMFSLDRNKAVHCSAPSNAKLQLLGTWERRRFGLNGSGAGFWPPIKHSSLLASLLQGANTAV